MHRRLMQAYHMWDACLLGTCRMTPGSSRLTPTWALVVYWWVPNSKFLVMVLWIRFVCQKRWKLRRRKKFGKELLKISKI